MATQVLNGHHRLVLKLIGVWPGIDFARLRVLLFIVTFILTVTYASASAASSLDNFHDLDILSANIIAIFGGITVFLQYAFIMVKRSTALDIVEEMIKDDIESMTEDAEIMRILKRGKKISQTMVYLSYNLSIMYITEFFGKNYLSKSSERSFPNSDLKFPFDAKVSPWFEIISIIFVVKSILSVTFNALTEGMLALVVTHAGIKAEILQREVQNFSDVSRHRENANPKDLKAGTKRLIELHDNFCMYCEQIEEVFSPIAFINILNLTVIQTFSLYIVLDGVESGKPIISLIRPALFAVTFYTIMAYHCIAGEYLTYKCEEVYEKFITCDWYEFKISEQKAISLALRKAEKSSYLSSGGLQSLNIAQLTGIAKATYTYLSIVRAFR